MTVSNATLPMFSTPLSAPAAPRLLVLDTATEFLHLGLSAHGRAFTRWLAGGALASSTLLPALRGLLEEAGVAWHDLDAIGFGCGPGAFTGVRAACAVTQGLAFGLAKPVLRLDTLMAVADDARARFAGLGLSHDNAVWVAVDARMGEAYTAAYRWAGDATDPISGEPGATDAGWQMLSEPALRDPAELAGSIEPGCGVVGNSLLAHAQAWARFAGPRAPDAAPNAESLLRLAARQWARGERLDAALALPHYVRDRVALTTAEREAVRLAKQAAMAVDS